MGMPLSWMPQPHVVCMWMHICICRSIWLLPRFKSYFSPLLLQLSRMHMFLWLQEKICTLNHTCFPLAYGMLWLLWAGCMQARVTVSQTASKYAPIGPDRRAQQPEVLFLG